MTRRRRRLTRWLTSLAFATALLAGSAGTPARAQQPAPEGEGAPAAGEGSGRSGDGYIATLFLTGVILFAVGKSARR